MDPMTIVIMFGICLAALVLVMVGFILGMFGVTQARGPPMTIKTIDCFPMLMGASPEEMWIKYHPSTGFFKQNVEAPDQRGYVRLVRRSGFFGMKKSDLFWKENDLFIVGVGKRQKAFHMPQLITKEIARRIDELAHENSTLVDQLAEARQAVHESQRDVRAQIDDQIDKDIKRVKEMQPVIMQRKNYAGGGQR